MNDNELNQNQVLNDENQQPENNGKSNLDNMMIFIVCGLRTLGSITNELGNSLIYIVFIHYYKF